MTDQATKAETEHMEELVQAAADARRAFETARADEFAATQRSQDAGNAHRQAQDALYAAVEDRVARKARGGE